MATALPVPARIACAAAALPHIHRDPFDRVIVALAQTQALTVLTSDEDIPKYPGVTVIWSSRATTWTGTSITAQVPAGATSGQSRNVLRCRRW